MVPSPCKKYVKKFHMKIIAYLCSVSSSSKGFSVKLVVQECVATSARLMRVEESTFSSLLSRNEHLHDFECLRWDSLKNLNLSVKESSIVQYKLNFYRQVLK
jgi:hypothetical protein